MTESQKDFLRNQLEDCLNKSGIDTHKSMMSCPICGDKDGFHFMPRMNKTIWKCFSAKHNNYGSTSGDIFTYVEQLQNINFRGACDILMREYNLIENLNGTYTPKKLEFSPKQKTPEQISQEHKIEEDRKSYAEFEHQEVEKILNVVKNSPSEYLHQRGISYETQKRYNIGYLSNFVHPKILWNNRNNPNFKVHSTPRAIIPTSKGSILARATRPQDEGENSKYKVLKVGETQVFNADILKENIGYCFCFEGEIDALSGIECGCNSIGLGSTSMTDKLFQEYEINHNNVLIIALDNDKGGFNSTPKIENWCRKLKIPYILADVNTLYQEQKDANASLCTNREIFENSLKNEIEKAKKFDISKYLSECDELIKKEQEKKLSQDTPIFTLDFHGRVKRGMYLIGDNIKYCAMENRWYIYDGTRLFPDKTKKIKKLLFDRVPLQMYKEHLKLKYQDENNNETMLKNFNKEVKYVSTLKALNETIEGLSFQDSVAITLLDMDKSNMLNCENITLDLTTLEPHQHRIEDLCTKLAPVQYNIPLNPECIDNWNRFISDIMCNDHQMIEFIQRCFGYILELTNREECFFILFGSSTRNGKSTLLESIKGVLGDYARAISSSTLAEKPTGKEANPEIISLIGTKLIICGELNAETLLNDTLLKSMIGNDTNSARNLHSNDVLNFVINGKLFANCNELPPMKNDDLLNSDRIIVIPFERHFSEHEQNKDLKKIFATPEYRAVILSWLIEGYKRYRQYGIKVNMPNKVKQAIKNYQSEANSINVFLNDDDIFERIDIKNYAEAVKITDKRLYSTYSDWCRENNCKPLSSANFKKQLKKNRYYLEQCRYQNVRYFNILASFKLKDNKLVITDDSNNNNPNRLVAIEQCELDRLKSYQR